MIWLVQTTARSAGQQPLWYSLALLAVGLLVILYWGCTTPAPKVPKRPEPLRMQVKKRAS